MDKLTHSRRRFLAMTGTAMAGFGILPGRLPGQTGSASPNGNVQLAGVGVGGVGFSQLQDCEKAGFKIVALCDVDDNYAKKAFDRWPEARRYRDFREMLQNEGDKVDAVHVGTPDHTHALITLASLRRKKHVCCVKPLTRTLHEASVVVETAKKMGVATQVTAAPHTGEEGARTCELIWAGAIGHVREVHIWSNRPLWPQGMARPANSETPPSTFDWNLWLGPAAPRPYVGLWPEDHYALKQIKAAGDGKPWYSSVYHPFNFRGWWDFGTGALGDMGCHYFNTPYKALKLNHPRFVHATATKVGKESAPLASLVAYDHEARESMPPVRVVWYDGGLRPPAPLEWGAEPLPEEGVLYKGDEGCMLGSRILNETREKQFASTPKTLPRRGVVFKEWIEACKGGEKAGCPFEWAAGLNEAVLLGNIAIRAGKRLEWNPAKMEFVANPDAGRYIQETYHNGWSLES
jgi:hypothetical protein